MPTDAGILDAADSLTSRFTRRDLHLLGQSSVKSTLRVIALIDFDCFYAQCEGVRLGLPTERPLGVQQFQHVIAINYAARAAGLKKVVTAVEAREKCPDIVLQHVPTWREGDATWRYRDDALQHMTSDKSSLDYYRLESRKAIAIVKNALPGPSAERVEKAGIDEVFVDLSAAVYDVLIARYPELLACEFMLPKPAEIILDWGGDQLVEGGSDEEEHNDLDWDDIALQVGSEMVRKVRKEIFDRLQYTCSAGIAHNKVVAKLAAGHNKPNQQTVIKHSGTQAFLSGYKLTKLRGLGGKLGRQTVAAFGTEAISSLLEVPLREMQSKLGSSAGTWVHQVIRGVEDSEVVRRTEIKSMLSAKTFSPSITGLEQAERWLSIFAADIVGRLEDEEGRRPSTVAVHHHLNGRFGPTRSKQTPIPKGAKLDTACLLTLSRDLLVKLSHEGPSWPCLSLSVSVSHFQDVERSMLPISAYTTAASSKASTEASGDHVPLKRPPDEQLSSERPRKRTILDFQGFGGCINEDKPKESDHQDTTHQSTLKSLTAVGISSCDSSKTLVEEPDREGMYSCPFCTEQIPSSGVLEHLDWHAALDLRNESQRIESPRSPSEQELMALH